MTATATKMNRRQVAPILGLTFPDYAGRRIMLAIAPKFTISSEQLCWSEGNKTEVKMVVNRGGDLLVRSLDEAEPWAGNTWSGQIPTDAMIVTLERFPGDGGHGTVRFTVAPGSTFLPKVLPAAKVAQLEAAGGA